MDKVEFPLTNNDINNLENNLTFLAACIQRILLELFMKVLIESK